MNTKSIFKSVGRSLNRNSPSILTGLGIAGFITTIGLAIEATPRAFELIRDESPNGGEYLSVREIYNEVSLENRIKLTWKVYIPTAGMASLSILSILMANRINLGRQAALASLYAFSEATLREYQNQVIQTIGARKEDKIQGEVANQKLVKAPKPRDLIENDEGKTLCFESLTGRYFYSDLETIRKAENDFNKQLLLDMHMTLNEFYYLIGLKPVTLGDEYGWIADENLLELRLDAKLSEAGTPCIVVDYAKGKMPRALWF